MHISFLCGFGGQLTLIPATVSHLKLAYLEAVAGDSHASICVAVCERLRGDQLIEVTQVLVLVGVGVARRVRRVGYDPHAVIVLDLGLANGEHGLHARAVPATLSTVLPDHVHVRGQIQHLARQHDRVVLVGGQLRVPGQHARHLTGLKSDR